MIQYDTLYVTHQNDGETYKIHLISLWVKQLANVLRVEEASDKHGKPVASKVFKSEFFT